MLDLEESVSSWLHVKSFPGSDTEVESHFGTAPHRGPQMIIDLQMYGYLARQACTIVGETLQYMQ